MSPVFTFGKVLLFIFCMALLPANAFSSDNADKEQAAIAAAGHWLALVDQGDYVTSFREAAAKFQDAPTPEQWKQELLSWREPAGAVISRIVKRSVHWVGPLGRDNVDIWYKTSFRNMKSADERVYIRLVDGQWRVTAYVITADELKLTDILMALLLTVVIAGIWVMEVKSELRPASDARVCSFPRQDGPKG